MDITAANKIADLRRRVAANVAAGVSPYEGISPEELRESIDALRANRSLGPQRGGAAGAKTKKAAASAKAGEKKAPSMALKNLLDGLED